MYIDGVLVDSVPVKYSAYLKAKDKQKYLEKLAKELAYVHRNKLIGITHRPEFFLDRVPSKLNKKAR